MNSQNRLIFKISKSSLNKHLRIHWSCFDTFFMHKIYLTHTEKEEKRMKQFFPFFENFDRDFRTLGIEIVKIWLQIQTRRCWIKLYANFGKFGFIILSKITVIGTQSNKNVDQQITISTSIFVFYNQMKWRIKALLVSQVLPSCITPHTYVFNYSEKSEQTYFY